MLARAFPHPNMVCSINLLSVYMRSALGGVAEARAHVQPLQHCVLGILWAVQLLLVGGVRALCAGLLQLVRLFLAVVLSAFV